MVELGIVGLRNGWGIVRTEVRLIWSVPEQDSELVTVGRLLELCSQNGSLANSTRSRTFLNVSKHGTTHCQQLSNVGSTILYLDRRIYF